MKWPPNARNVLYGRVRRCQPRARKFHLNEIPAAGLVLDRKSSEKLLRCRVRPEVERDIAKLWEGNATTRSGV